MSRICLALQEEHGGTVVLHCGQIPGAPQGKPLAMALETIGCFDCSKFQAIPFDFTTTFKALEAAPNASKIDRQCFAESQHTDYWKCILFKHLD